MSEELSFNRSVTILEKTCFAEVKSVDRNNYTIEFRPNVPGRPDYNHDMKNMTKQDVVDLVNEWARIDESHGGDDFFVNSISNRKRNEEEPTIIKEPVDIITEEVAPIEHPLDIEKEEKKTTKKLF